MPTNEPIYGLTPSNGEIKDSRAVESVIRALGVDAYDLSRVAVEALGKIGDPRAVEPLIEMMRHREFSYRISAVQALIDIGGPAVEPLIKALESQDPDIRLNAVKALGGIKDPRVVEPLVMKLGDKEVYMHSPVVGERGEIKDAMSLRRDLRDSAVQLLINIGGPAVEPLIKALESQDPDIRLNAVKALGEIKDLRAIKVLTERLKDENKSVREAAEAAVVKIQKANPKL